MQLINGFHEKLFVVRMKDRQKKIVSTFDDLLGCIADQDFNRITEVVVRIGFVVMPIEDITGMFHQMIKNFGETSHVLPLSGLLQSIIDTTGYVAVLEQENTLEAKVRI